MFIWNETQPYWRSGPWNGRLFAGVPNMTADYLNGFQVGNDGEGNTYIYFTLPGGYGPVLEVLNPQGQLKETRWNDEQQEMIVSWTNRQSDCDVYGICGSFAICNAQSSPICSCLKGFEPSNKEEWNRQNWTNGCSRRAPLQYERARSQNTSADNNADEFLNLQMVKVPDFPEQFWGEPDTCRSECLKNRSCVAYSYDDGIGCISWTRDLLDMQQFSGGGLDLFVRVAYSEVEHGTNKTIIITITVIIGTLIIVTCAFIMWKTSYNPAKIGHLIMSARKRSNKDFQHFNNGEPSKHTSNKVIEELSHVKLQELLLFDFQRVATATNNFHSSNKLGEGGFGPVYKGKMPDGQEIAVKRLSRASGQGLNEFMNEVVVISKLQHRNLVRLFGCCVEGEEKMLIYEYMPNKSLDVFIFDPSKSKVLDWRKRCNIIEGIARGLLYLHRDSRLKIIHRDLKTGNILLDEQLNPKISDFGMARIFGGTENEANTNRIVGTYGYMSPEYAMQGLFSEKSDVFSFGVLVLEIVSGRKNSSFYDDEHALTLLGFAWTQWREGNILSLIDPKIYNPSNHEDILRCINIGLLCVQEHAMDRPTMAAVISMFNSEAAFLPSPSQPAFIQRQNMTNSNYSTEGHKSSSINAVSITDIHGIRLGVRKGPDGAKYSTCQMKAPMYTTLPFCCREHAQPREIRVLEEDPAEDRKLVQCATTLGMPWNFSLNIVQRINIVEAFIWNETQPHWRSGPWNGRIFVGINMTAQYLNGFQGGNDGEGNTYLYFTVPDGYGSVLVVLNPRGQLEETRWIDDKELIVSWTTRQSDCDVYGICGSFAICNAHSSPICSCLKGFEPRNKEEWNRQNWTSGCARKAPLQCERASSQNTSADNKADEFLNLQMVKVPDFPEQFSGEPDICRSECLKSCSCVAYSYDDGIGCISWTRDLLDMQQFSGGGLDLFVRVAYSEVEHAKIWHSIRSARKRSYKDFQRFNNEPSKDTSNIVMEELSHVKLQELLLFDFQRVATATNNFHSSNKLGEGGFGPVYKAWTQWREGNILSLIDPKIYNPSNHEDILRCINIGLLCVQEHAMDRPTMAAVISMFNSEVAFLPSPSQPAFIQRQNMTNCKSSTESHKSSSINAVSITDIHGR
ncbi:hypothetical protein VNO78_15945 [Psophocarpus tetragonolobus]|uniref:non-specific serine/threonine protein kinase n=1 Tax=Psophocarpus tetragonolobus TaxID=3891 RepID=A0AAN9SEX0_PSOTE